MIGKTRARMIRVVTTTARPKGPMARSTPTPLKTLLSSSIIQPIG